jgi:hypothetical protein
MNPADVGILCEGLLWSLGDAKITFSTFEEGCLWLLGHKHNPFRDDGFYLTFVDDVVYEGSRYQADTFITKEAQRQLGLEDSSLGMFSPNVEKRHRLHLWTINESLRVLPWHHLRNQGCLCTTVPITIDGSLLELILNLGVGRTISSQASAWHGVIPHFLGISARV